MIALHMQQSVLRISHRIIHCLITYAPKQQLLYALLCICVWRLLHAYGALESGQLH